MLVSPPVVAYTQFDKEFTLVTDASGEAVVGVLEQGRRAMGYAGRMLNPAERNYSNSERELLALTWATKNYRCYLLGRPVKMFTDHKPLKGMLKAKDTTSSLQSRL